tara:strand:+ start:391 stop:585 length:195 start_codon:yes stop_codon:yes gene_type:complete
MALIGGRLVKKSISFPCPGSHFFIEDNIGDHNAIHIHMGPNAKQIRLHFTYDEWRDLVKALKET